MRDTYLIGGRRAAAAAMTLAALALASSAASAQRTRERDRDRDRRAESTSAADRDEDWLDRCRDGGRRDDDRRGRDDRERFCEVRHLGTRAAGRALTVDAGPNGGVAINGWDRDSVDIHVRIQTQADDADEARDMARDIKVTTGATISADGPESGRRRSWSVSYEIWAPRGSDLVLDTHNGPIAVREVSGRMELTAHNGPVVLTSVGGDVRARTTNGPITVSLDGDRFDGRGLDAETTNGPIHVRLSDRFAAHLEVGTTNGPMSIDFPVTVQGRIGRRISTDINGGGPPIRVITTNGPVVVERR
jgi:hypothetical protein